MIKKLLNQKLPKKLIHNLNHRPLKSSRNRSREMYSVVLQHPRIKADMKTKLAMKRMMMMTWSNQ